MQSKGLYNLRSLAPVITFYLFVPVVALEDSNPTIRVVEGSLQSPSRGAQYSFLQPDGIHW